MRQRTEIRRSRTGVTLWGERVDLTTSIWRLKVRAVGDQLVTLNVGLLDRPRERSLAKGRYRSNEAQDTYVRRMSSFSRRMRQSLRAYLASEMSRVSPRHLLGSLHAFVRFERFLHDENNQTLESFDIADLTVVCFDSFLRYCMRASDNGRYPVLLRQFYGWASREYPVLFSSRVYRALKQITCPSPIFGHIVRMRDPVRGALSWAERLLVEQALAREESVVPSQIGRPADLQTYSNTRVLQRERDRAVIWLFYALGIRAEVLPFLRWKHLRMQPKYLPDVDPVFLLDVPHVKRQGRSPENVVVTRSIPYGLGCLLVRLAAPESDADALLLHWLASGLPLQAASKAIRRWADEHELVSERVPREREGWVYKRRAHPIDRLPRLPLTAQRLRRNMASMLAEEGADEDEIAAALDDKTIAMAAVYVEQSGALFDLLRDTLDKNEEWIRVMKLFAGSPCEDPTTGMAVILGGAPFLSDYESYADIGVIGNCTFLQCQKEPPVSCYLCEFFRWVTDPRPHERQLTQLLRDSDLTAGLASDRVRATLRRHAAAILQLIETLVENADDFRGVLAAIRMTATAATTPATR